MQTQLMPSLFQRVTFTLSFLALSTLALAQSKTDAPRKKQIDWNKPIAVASIASIDRVLDDIDYMFATIDKPEFPAMLKGFLAQYRNLEGIDKTRPLGVFVFLKEGISPQPEVVGYIPIQDLDALKQTLEEVGFFLNPVEGKEDRYTLALPAFTLHLKLAHDYAFVQIKSEALDRDFYNPDEFTSALAKKYDIAASLLLKYIPEPMRMMAVDLANARIDQKLPNLPQETDLKRQSQKTIELMLSEQADLFRKVFENGARDGTEVTFGFNMSQEKKQIQIHLGLKARPGSELAKQLKQYSELSSQYSYLDQTTSAASGYSVYALRENVEQKLLLDMIEKSKTDIPPVLLGDKTNPGPASKMLKSAEATVRSGKLDTYLQMVPVDNEKMVVIGAVKLSDAASFKEGLQEFFDLAGQADEADGIKANVAEIEGIDIHQIAPDNIKENPKKVFGEDPVLFIGCSDDECWLTVGEVSSVKLLKSAITASRQKDKQLKTGTPFQFTMKIGSLLPLAEKNNRNPKFEETAKVAFASGGDLMTFYPKIAADEASLNLDFGEGFIRLFSLAFANARP